MFNGKIDKFTEFDNQISNLNSDKLEHLREIKKLDDEISNKEEERLNYGIKYYLEKGKRESLLSQAKEYGYSETKINALMPYVDNWNQDIITKDIIDSFRMVEKFVNDNQDNYKVNIFYKFSKFINGEEVI